MRLFEMAVRPKVAGKATLKYKELQYPERLRSTILIPDCRTLEMFPLQEDWSQFLISTSDEQVYFGGTDENPFLVQLSQNTERVLMEQGIEAFYLYLKPSLITKLESVLGVSAVRQGDIFACPLPLKWEELVRAISICSGKEAVSGEIKSQNVFDTRHTLAGRGLVIEIMRATGVLGMQVPAVVEGIITAPDHSPLELNGPHVLSQTHGLYNPREAD